ncbi:MAG: hypothetical protein ACYS22_12225 [Planctomycetota bacterium]|jgi:hypothetical protein
MAESTRDIFLRIAVERGFVTPEQRDEVLSAYLAAKESAGGVKATPVEQILVDRGLLTVPQVKGIDRGVRYYIVRKADKAYGRIAKRRGLIDQSTLKNCLKKQKLDFTKRLVLSRLSKLLLEVEAITPEQHEAVCQAVIDEKSKKREAARAASAESVDPVAPIEPDLPTAAQAIAAASLDPKSSTVELELAYEIIDDGDEDDAEGVLAEAISGSEPEISFQILDDTVNDAEDNGEEPDLVPPPLARPATAPDAS